MDDSIELINLFSDVTTSRDKVGHGGEINNLDWTGANLATAETVGAIRDRRMWWFTKFCCARRAYVAFSRRGGAAGRKEGNGGR